MSKTRTVAWMVWLIASIFYAYQYILRVMPNIMMTDILHQFDIDVTVFGQFSGIYYIGYSLMHIPVGIMLDRYGPKKVMPLCILMTVVGLTPILVSDYWVYPIIGRALIGMGSSAAILGTFKIIRLTFDEKRFTRMLSCSVTIGLIGAIYGGGPVNYMCELWGYKAVVGLFICMGTILAIMTHMIIPDSKVAHTSSIYSNIKSVFGTSKVMAICLCAGFMVGPLEGFADVWGAGFLKQVYGFESLVAASLASMIFIGMCFGGPILSLISERTNSCFGTIIAAGLIMAIGFILLLGTSLSSQNISIVFVIIGVCSAYQIIAIYKTSTYVKEDLVGLTTAVANMIIMIFGYIFHSVIGMVIDATGGVTNADALSWGITTIPIGLILGSIGFTIIAITEYIPRKRTLGTETI